VESERSANETIDKAKALADKTLNEARAESHRVLSEARTEADLTTQAARREVEDLTRQKDAVTSQLGQMLSGLAGIVPGVGAAAKAEPKAADKDETEEKVPADTAS
jgi:cell division septum initiation protein DivIVA